MRVSTQLIKDAKRKRTDMKLQWISGVVLALMFVVVSSAYAQQDAGVLLQSGLYKEEVNGDLEAAIKVYERVLQDFPKDRLVAAKAQLHIGVCYEKLGNAQARAAYESVVRDYADQSEIVAQARVRLAALGGPGAAGGLVARRVLADASGVGGVLTADGKYIRGIDWDTGDVVQFEIASGQTSRITNRGPWSETRRPRRTKRSHATENKSHTTRSSDPNTKDWVYQLRIRNLDGSGLRTLYSGVRKTLTSYPLDWSPDAGSILAFREA